jgi:adenine-specific DNA-methyltransferase
MLSSHHLIQQENLEFLKDETTSNKYKLVGGVDTIYIDPPYNTGNHEATGFVYNDTFGRHPDRHTLWLNFMKERLVLAKTLLKPAGVIVVSIDDSEAHRLRVLMDEVFGENNFIAQLVVDGGNPKNNARFFSTTHEYMLVYARSATTLYKTNTKWRKRRDGIDKLLKEYMKATKRYKEDYEQVTVHLKNWVKTQKLTKRLKVFYNADQKGLYTYSDLSAPGVGLRYEVKHPVTGKPCQIPSRGWGLSEEKFRALNEAGLVLYGKDETFQPLKKLYLQDRKDQVQKAILEYPSRTSTHLLEKLLGRKSSFNNPKNLKMMADLVDLITPPDGVVLDFFAGSGTTGHAVLMLNTSPESNRTFVLVTNNENNIFNDVTKPRLVEASKALKTADVIKIVDTPQPITNTEEPKKEEQTS